MSSKTRGRLRGLALLTGATLALAGCSGGTVGGDSGPASEEAAAQFTPATDGVLRLYTWSNYFTDEFLQSFTDETGIDITVDFYDSNEVLEAKLRASGGTGYDVIVPSDYMVEILAEADLLMPVDVPSLPNGGNVDERFANPDYDPGLRYTVPYLVGTTGFAYNTAAAGGETLDSWADYFNPPAGLKVGVLNDQVAVINAALRATGGELCTSDPDELQAAQDLLMDFKPRVNTINSEGIISRLATGEDPVGMIWSGSAQRAIEENPDVTYVYPEEGMTLYTDTLAIPSGAENVDQAKTFLNWMMDPENSAIAASNQKYISPITGADEFIDPELLASPAITIPADYTGAQRSPVCDNDTVANYTAIWEAFRG